MNCEYFSGLFEVDDIINVEVGEGSGAEVRGFSLFLFFWLKSNLVCRAVRFVAQ